MRLCSIKLAGFKSFVEPAHFQVPGQRIGIVGPNGCGKSNLIDAVRWVLGESRAAELRGESMQDVIFNGSGGRKPASRASVELVFENEGSGKAGPWSQYAEIAVKRVLTRDGGSNYFINNQNVRRRDVQDIFLGTGLGPRAYAIIGQGMIARIIEAKPEELRIFLEEAAGVSKYKERRRETENRLFDARENLTRIEDIRRELSANLDKLEQQAARAQHYQALRAEHDEQQHLLWLVQKNDAQAEVERQQHALDAARAALDRQTTQLRALEAQLETQRATHTDASAAVASAQSALFEAQAEVSRFESEMHFLTEAHRRAQAQIELLTAQHAQWRSQQNTARTELAQAQQAQAHAQAFSTQAQAAAQTDSAALPDAEGRVEQARAARAQVRDEMSQLEQTRSLNAAQRQHAEQLLQQLDARRARLQRELDTLAASDRAPLEALQTQLSEHQIKRDEAHTQLTQAQAAAQQADQAQHAARERVQNETALLKQDAARLEALQQVQRNIQSGGALAPWLAQHNLATQPRLWQTLRIEAGWETALEAVLRERLGAFELPDLDAIAALAASAPPAKLAFYTPLPQAEPLSENLPTNCSERVLSKEAGALAPECIQIHEDSEQRSMRVEQVSVAKRWRRPRSELNRLTPHGARAVNWWTGSEALDGLQPLLKRVQVDDPAIRAALFEALHHVFTSETIERACAARLQLPAGGVLVVPAGHQISRMGVQFYAADSEQSGVLARAQEIATLAQRVRAQTGQVEAARTRAAQAEAAQQAARRTLTDARAQHEQAIAQVHALQLETQKRAQAHQNATERRAHLAEEVVELDAQIAAQRARIDACAAHLKRADDQLERLKTQVDEAKRVFATLDAEREQARQRARESERAALDAHYAARMAANRVDELNRAIQAADGQVEQTQSALERARAERDAIDLEAPQRSIEAARIMCAEKETQLADARAELDALSAQLRAADEARLKTEHAMRPLRDQIAELQLKEQAARLRRDQFAAQLQEGGVDASELAQKQSDGQTPAALQREVTRLKREIDALGAINMAALDELTAARARAHFLAAQADDLNTAMDTLENAIRTIDRETRQLLQETFDVVNRHFGALFPRLFGGGQAKLMMTGDEILHAGVQVMAQPPGKKNATIHLLSGGEKALTATALVFALFQLNPAPFCLLDEVDAPLDDANTERFIQLVREMSERTQFLFITHSKQTMEMAQQLIGVTMQEQGVSRIVAVDVENMF